MGVRASLLQENFSSLLSWRVEEEEGTSGNHDKQKCDVATVTRDDDTFSPFDLLSVEVVLEILSYISNGPCECNGEAHGTLTHVFPIISWELRWICDTSENLWISSLQRLVNNDPSKWQAGLLSILRYGHTLPPWSVFYRPDVDQDHFVLAASVLEISSANEQQLRDLLQKICYSMMYPPLPLPYRNNHNLKFMGGEGDNATPPSRAKALYLSLVRGHDRISLPVFSQTCLGNGNYRSPNFKVGKKKRLTLPHYPPMSNHWIAMLEESSKKKTRRSNIDAAAPRFLITASNSLCAVENAILVKAFACERLRADGSVDLTVIPIREEMSLSQITLPDARGSHCTGFLGEACVRRFS